MSILWTEKEVEELKRLVKEGKDREFLANHFNRTETAIEVKVNRIGLQLQRPQKRWKKKDIEQFKLDWQDGSMSIPMIMKKYGRSYLALRKKSLQLNLGARPYNDEYLSINDICLEMNVSRYRVYNWIKLGLKTKKNRSGRVNYLVSQDNLLSFLKEHQDMFNASEISDYLFTDEPDWLKDKRAKDLQYYNENLRCEYTNEEDKRIISLFKRGKSIDEIAKEFKRTPSAISNRLKILGYTIVKYNDYEIDILKENSRFVPVSELAKMLPLRTEKGIIYKCGQLNIPYYTSLSKCEKRKEN